MPGLAVVLVGNRGDSETYVRSKKKACEEVGIASFGTDLPEDVSEEELLQVPSTVSRFRSSMEAFRSKVPWEIRGCVCLGHSQLYIDHVSFELGMT